MAHPGPGLFITGTDTGVGKTYVASLIARALAATGRRVGVYKPVASGCLPDKQGGRSADAVELWEAAGQTGDLDRVCPQRFEASVAPHLAARAEGRRVNRHLLRSGLDYWTARSQVVVVEGAGGLMSPVSDEDYVADLAAEFGFPLIVVADNRLGVINATLQTLIAAANFRPGLRVAGIVLNDASDDPDDKSRDSNFEELRTRCSAPLLGHLRQHSVGLEPSPDWWSLACGRPSRTES